MFKELKIQGAKLYSPNVFYDKRGLFFESYNEKEFRTNGINCRFIQDNVSRSLNKYTIRGLHFQKGKYAQSKLVKCVRGKILDVIVDLREDSDTFLDWEGVYLSCESNDMIFVPRGCAHGFITLEDNCEVHYKVDNIYHKKSERTLIYNDRTININWGIDLCDEKIVLSNKDLNGSRLEDLDF